MLAIDREGRTEALRLSRERQRRRHRPQVEIGDRQPGGFARSCDRDEITPAGTDRPPVVDFPTPQFHDRLRHELGDRKDPQFFVVLEDEPRQSGEGHQLRRIPTELDRRQRFILSQAKDRDRTVPLRLPGEVLAVGTQRLPFAAPEFQIADLPDLFLVEQIPNFSMLLFLVVEPQGHERTRSHRVQHPQASRLHEVRANRPQRWHLQAQLSPRSCKTPTRGRVESE